VPHTSLTLPDRELETALGHRLVMFARCPGEEPQDRERLAPADTTGVDTNPKNGQGALLPRIGPGRSKAPMGTHNGAPHPHWWAASDALSPGLDSREELLFGTSAARAITLAESATSSFPSTAAGVVDLLAAADTFTHTDQPTRGREHSDAAAEQAQRWQHKPLLALAYSARSAANQRLGLTLQAVHDARTSIQLIRECRMSIHSPLALLPLARLIETLIDAARYDEAVNALGLSNLGGQIPDGPAAGFLYQARGRLRTALGHGAEGIRDLIRSGETFTRRGISNPAVTPWRSQAALALRASGRWKIALAYAEQEVELARDWGIRGPLASALHAQAVIVGGPTGLTMLEEATALVHTSEDKIRRAQILLAHGGLLSRTDQKAAARHVLKDALVVAQEIEHPRLLDVIRAELTAAGGRPPRPARSGVAGLTRTEHKIAEFAASGRTNKEIAELLFVVPRTVEIHLTNTYRKLGISGRSELRDKLNG
jgi:DNA-binding CsgD family transcriptional regulator